MARRIGLVDAVRPAVRVAPEDLGQVRWALSRIGLYDPARDSASSEALMGPGLRRALRVFQSGQGLRDDAVLRPRGPTERRLNRLLDESRDLRIGSVDREARATRESTPGVLAGRVGRRLENHPDDVASVGAALRQLGYISLANMARPNMTALFRALGRFQRTAGLKRDGVIAPDGPTERLLLGTPVRGPRTPRIAQAGLEYASSPMNPVPREAAQVRAEDLASLPFRARDRDAEPVFLSHDERAGPALRHAAAQNFGDLDAFSQEAPTHFGTPTSPASDTRPSTAGRKSRRIPPTPERRPPTPPTIHDPTGGFERNDPAGRGWFGAPRTRKPQGHRGVDIEIQPGAPVVSPIDGRIKRRGFAYDKKTPLNLVVIEGTGEYKGLEIRILYVDSRGPKGPVKNGDKSGEKDGVGAPVRAGTTIVGLAQDVTKKGNNEKQGMKPHIHLEAFWLGKRIDPARILPLWESEKPN